MGNITQDESMHHDSNASFYAWLLIVGVISFGFFLLWDFQLLERLFIGDITYLSSVILLIFFATSVYLGRAAWILSVQKHYAVVLENSTETPLEEILVSYSRSSIIAWRPQ